MARILVIDDYEPILAMLRVTLESAGHEVATAADGATGLVMLPRLKPDLLLVDVDMPGRDGVSVCAEVKRTAATAGMVVLLMTGRPCAELMQRSRAAGAAGVLAKPFVRAVLLDEVERVTREVRPVKT